MNFEILGIDASAKVVASLVVATSLYAVPVDKQAHFGVSLALAGWGETYFHTRTSKAKAALYGFGAAMSVGVVKESYDALQPNGSGWDWEDLGYDAAGAFIGVWLSSVINGISMSVTPLNGGAKTTIEWRY